MHDSGFAVRGSRQPRQRTLLRFGPIGLALLLSLFLLSGCGSDLVAVGGRVLYDGQPLQEGQIRFVAPDGNGPTAAARIEKGSYSVRIPPGPKKVEIEGYRTVGKAPYDPTIPSSPLVDVIEQVVPARYNTNSELTREITAGCDTMDFVLESR